jgi:hypothetical protein
MAFGHTPKKAVMAIVVSAALKAHFQTNNEFK